MSLKEKQSQFEIAFLFYTGGNVWESNPPKKLLTPHASFED